MSKIVWHEWGQDAFAKARSAGKPILLDITGSWCHWCHVMDETSYSDPVIVSVINKSFIPIRVDTDQRPDVNRRYNLGGWPTTAFLDEKGRIITGGTYIPPMQLRDVLRSVLDFYSTKKGEVRSRLQSPRVLTPSGEPLSEKITSDISTTIAVNFDIDYGGFGFEPKFPHAEALDYALLRHRYYGEKEMLTVATRSLDRMGNGGIYDQVEQGFFRYSTTRDWAVPHFEKMAEDNAKLLTVYLHAFQTTGKTFYRDRAEGIVNYVLANLSDSKRGGFFGSQDADEEYYKKDLTGRKSLKLPSVDRTLFSNYNGLLVSSFLLASVVLSKESIGKFALKTLDRLLELGKEGPFPFRYWRDEETPMFKGLLADYATLLNSFIDAYEFSGRPLYLEKAQLIANDCLESFGDATLGGFYDVPPSESNLGELKAKDKPIDENSVVALALLRLSWLTSRTDLATAASKTLELFEQEYERIGLAAAVYGLAVDSYLKGPVGITIIASKDSETFAAFKQEALNIYSARRYLVFLDPSRDSDTIARLGYNKQPVPAAYVCVGKTCGPPIRDPSGVGASLASLLEAKPLASAP